MKKKLIARLFINPNPFLGAQFAKIGVAFNYAEDVGSSSGEMPELLTKFELTDNEQGICLTNITGMIDGGSYFEQGMNGISGYSIHSRSSLCFDEAVKFTKAVKIAKRNLQKMEDEGRSYNFTQSVKNMCRALKVKSVVFETLSQYQDQPMWKEFEIENIPELVHGGLLLIAKGRDWLEVDEAL